MSAKPLSENVWLLEQSWGEIGYDQALEKQKSLTRQGRCGWLLFAPKPTITLGRRAQSSDVLLTTEQLAQKGCAVLQTDRGGQVTYHGPSQCVGFPVGTLEQFTGDPRGVRAFIQKLQTVLIEVLAPILEGRIQLRCSDDGAKAGIWLSLESDCDDGSNTSHKLVAFGMKFSREGISHGFAINLWPDDGFDWINPCGDPGTKPAFLFQTPPSQQELRSLLLNLSQGLIEAWITVSSDPARSHY